MVIGVSMEQMRLRRLVHGDGVLSCPAADEGAVSPRSCALSIMARRFQADDGRGQERSLPADDSNSSSGPNWTCAPPRHSQERSTAWAGAEMPRRARPPGRRSAEDGSQPETVMTATGWRSCPAQRRLTATREQNQPAMRSPCCTASQCWQTGPKLALVSIMGPEPQSPQSPKSAPGSAGWTSLPSAVRNSLVVVFTSCRNLMATRKPVFHTLPSLRPRLSTILLGLAGRQASGHA